jgi:SAM-dependent methyltransferase
MNPTQRFSDRVDDYVRYRPSYPAALVALLAEAVGLGPGRVVADIGSGTGILTALLLKTGARVIGVEPNGPMRAAAERALAGEARFQSTDARAESTGLPSAAVDLVTAAQAFHWFDPEPARAEFVRILRPMGQVALIWNQRADTPLNRDYEALLERFAFDYRNVRERDRAAEPKVLAFFAPGVPAFATFSYEQRFDEPGLRGRLMSSSYAPRPDDPLHAPMMSELGALFRAHARHGEVTVEYQTIVWYGLLPPRV